VYPGEEGHPGVQLRRIVRKLALQKLNGIRTLHTYDAQIREGCLAPLACQWLQHCFSTGFEWSLAANSGKLASHAESG
jgi:hypothetical protein